MVLKPSFKKQPHNLFIPAALLLFIISFFPGGRVIDVHLHDTMFVITMAYFFWALAIVLVLFWMIYLFTNNILLTKYLTWIHIIATLIVLIVLISAMLLEDESRPEDITWKTIENDLHKEEIIIPTVSFLFLIGQSAFLINLLGGFCKRVFNRK
jgi:hypothetical protein